MYCGFWWALKIQRKFGGYCTIVWLAWTQIVFTFLVLITCPCSNGFHLCLIAASVCVSISPCLSLSLSGCLMVPCFLMSRDVVWCLQSLPASCADVSCWFPCVCGCHCHSFRFIVIWCLDLMFSGVSEVQHVSWVLCSGVWFCCMALTQKGLIFKRRKKDEKWPNVLLQQLL